MPERLRQLRQWLEQGCGFIQFSIEPASADASFRRYFRVSLPDATTRIAMDAPPGKEDCRPFVAIAGQLADAGVHVPQILAADLDAGFLLLEDLGSRPYLGGLDVDTADRLYGDAIGALVRFQRMAAVAPLPAYSRDLLMTEMRLFPEWLLGRHLGQAPGGVAADRLEQAFAALADNALRQPVVFVHRDYHSRNLMITGERNPGIIDFQDAVAGPVTYDLVSLLRDCYISWPEEYLAAWLTRYLDAARQAGLLEGVDDAQFRRWFDLMGVQRHLKAAGIFARLHHRDGKPGYLGDLPRTLAYVVAVGERYEQTDWLARYVAENVLPRL